MFNKSMHNHELLRSVRLTTPKKMVYYSVRDERTETEKTNLFNSLDFDTKVRVYLNFILRGEEFPVFMLDKETLKSVQKFFESAYISPLNVTLKHKDGTFCAALNYAQFLSLRQIFYVDIENSFAPLIAAPPEYWYAMALCHTANYGIPSENFDAQFSFVTNGKCLVVNAMKWIGLDQSYRFAGTLGVHNVLYGARTKPFTSGAQRGSCDLPRFSLSMVPFSLSEAVYLAYPEYWDIFKVEEIGECCARDLISVELAKIPQFVPPIVLPSVLPEVVAIEPESPQEVPVLLEDEEFTVSEKEIVNFVAQSLVPTPLVDSFESGAPCENEVCCFNLSAPVLLKQECDVDTEPGSRARLPANPFSLEDPGPLKGFVVVFPGKLRSYTSTKGRLLLCEADIWRDYVRLHALAAALGQGQLLYKNPPRMIRYDPDLEKTLWYKLAPKAKNGYETNLPRTFTKWANMFEKLGYVKFMNGKYPVNRPPRLGNVKILELGANPFGAMAAAIEAGICSTYWYSCFNSDHIEPPPYGDRVVDIMENCCAGEADLDAFIRAIEKRGGISPKFSMIIIDIPIETSSSAPMTNRKLIKKNLASLRHELQSDIPLAKEKAFADRAVSALKIATHSLCVGGSLILKVDSCLTESTCLEIFVLSALFAKTVAVRSPESRPCETELYFHFTGWRLGLAKDPNYGAFVSQMVVLNDAVYGLVAQNIRTELKKNTSPLKDKRIVGCRKKVSEYTGVRFVGRFNIKIKTHEYVDDFAEEVDLVDHLKDVIDF